MATTLIKDIIRQIHDLHDGDLWLDETFAKKIDQVNEIQAFTRPLPDLHSPAELLSHLIVWRRAVMGRLNGQVVRLELDDPSNWKTNDELRLAGWEALKKDFYQSKQEIIDLLNDKDDDYLDTFSVDYEKDFRYFLQGLVHHDLYHLGQLGISVKYLKK
ncbi:MULTISPECIES: DinB family protein [Chryseobacterium]|uniref:Damage-inducible protein DinB n=1 Tax=Chryseobacterium camelliae TaxID=1265445 RepID=A0ABU0TI41_9FLAO|nr:MULTISPECIES: DinB family protein [Chryseobacterium]MDT3406392.1 putative damage-inducible protein DinB [Pseudacidovorax intermedius]MDQ1095808.1 putative damage-inducible protein DinB [Chryseobacterium camelliae]MDQ1099745.1 putative damage-inducible protein DinB [Chryseobacterium sp. SORGH_AS_1048]MDR6087093.1 putative damage-inducible protein DinB [Chryseobacterium sp. SORGH_AS_0909]MDR6131466.1 putative damage-inducible protein DinB [Chryseobacterium sp. SORGH_AS_1175]